MNNLKRDLPSPRRTLGFVVTSLAAGLAAMACSSEDSALPNLQGGSGYVSHEIGEPCEPGAEIKCGVTLHQANDQATCYEGTQYCEDGRWGTCKDGTVVRRADTQSLVNKGFLDPQSISTPVPCAANPCDPECQYFIEDPTDITTMSGSGGGGPIPDWSTGGGTATCAHGLCADGTSTAPLNSACHPCVAKVCAANPSCCTGSPSTDDWDQACRDAVFTECVGTTPPAAVMNLCDFAAFADSRVRFGNGGTGKPVIGSGNGTDTEDIKLETNCDVGAIYSKGNVNLRNRCKITGNVVAQGDVWLEAGTSLADPTELIGNLTAGGTVEVRNWATITGNVQATSNVTMQANSYITGNVWDGGVLTLNNPSLLTGSAQSRGNITGQTNGHITGTATVNSGSSINPVLTIDGVQNTAGTVATPSVPELILPTVASYDRDMATVCAIAAAKPDANVWGPDLTLQPGVYGDIIVHGSNKLILDGGGAYVFNSLTFYSRGTLSAGLEMDERGDTTSVFDVSTCGQFRVMNRVGFYLSGTTTKPSSERFLVYSDGTASDTISFDDNNDFQGMFLAPNGGILLHNGNATTSAFWAKELWADYALNLTNIPKSACEGTNISGNATCDGTTAMYSNGTTYATGAKVFYKTGIYQCTNGTNCTAGGGYGGTAGYWPGEGLSWTSAWTLTGTCPTAASTDACPVSLNIPGTPAPRVPCYSGLDCQVNARCTEVLTGSTCEHSKCYAGAKLTSTCDSCVSRICAAQPSCCTTAWTQSCVDMIPTTCDATCGATTAVACGHDMCVTGGALNAACSPEVAAVCANAATAYCCSTTWDAACVAALYTNHSLTYVSPPAPGASICEFAMLGKGSAAIYSASIKGGALGWLPGSLAIMEQWPGAGRPYIDGTIYASGSVNLNSVDVTGAFYGPAGSSYTNGTPSGGVFIPGTVPTPTFPTKTFTCPTGGATSTGGSRTVAPGTYGTLGIDGGATLTLQAGTYTVQTLQTNWASKIQLPATGTVVFNVCDDAQFNGNTEVLSPSGDKLQFQVWVKNGVLNVQSGATLYGSFQVENNTITMGTDAKIYGFAHSYNGIVQMAKGALIDTTGYSGNVCRTAGLDPAYPATPACPVTTPLTPVITTSGTCVENGTTYQAPSSQCPNVDLAVDLPCGESIPVCNHGNTDVPANQAELVFYPRGGNQFATTTPQSYWSVGTCAVTAAIPAGTCVTQTCPATLLNQDLTVQARLSTGATVTECSALDNWSYFVDAYTCGGTSTPKVVSYEYEAVCPEDMGPSWGLLTWETTAPGASNLEFAGRVAATQAGLASASFTSLGTAHASPVDTRDCLVSGPNPECPVDITEKLWGTGGKAHQPGFLELQVTLNPSGSDAPILENWQITYSCIYDQ
jgi:hypothetical protein